MTRVRIGRLLTAMATPFDASGALDLDQAKRLAAALFDSGTVDGLPFYVMPYIQGETIRDLFQLRASGGSSPNPEL